MHKLTLSLLLAAALAPREALAVDPCRDATLGEHPSEQTTTVHIKGRGYQLERYGDRVRFTATVVITGLDGATLPVGTPIGLTLDNGTSVTLYSDQPAKPDGKAVATEYIYETYSTVSVSTYTTWRVSVPVSVVAAHAIASGRPVTMTVPQSAETTITHDLGRRYGSALQRDFACLANHISPEE